MFLVVFVFVGDDLVLVLISYQGDPWGLESMQLVGGWCKAGHVVLHEVGGTFVVVSDDVACSIAEGEFSVLLIALSQLRYVLLDRWCDGIFCELIPLDDPSYLKVKKFLAASPISHWAKTYAWGSAGYVRDIQRVWIVMHLCVCSKW